ncbi:hypothetical protein CEXT_123841 [Caerostris extrusa]|uniref:Uncharacterized protein n=1 Tax=Caerostris extrusa TaxID=172846 RepID=A0AAV4WEV9_CAEEX|nr:hypothetical protein CEXT_123841 [Caerostris extrusa]
MYKKGYNELPQQKQELKRLPSRPQAKIPKHISGKNFKLHPMVFVEVEKTHLKGFLSKSEESLLVPFLHSPFLWSFREKDRKTDHKIKPS